MTHRCAGYSRGVSFEPYEGEHSFRNLFADKNVEEYRGFFHVDDRLRGVMREYGASMILEDEWYELDLPWILQNHPHMCYEFLDPVLRKRDDITAVNDMWTSLAENEFPDWSGLFESIGKLGKSIFARPSYARINSNPEAVAIFDRITNCYRTCLDDFQKKSAIIEAEIKKLEAIEIKSKVDDLQLQVYKFKNKTCQTMINDLTQEIPRRMKIRAEFSVESCGEFREEIVKITGDEAKEFEKKLSLFLKPTEEEIAAYEKSLAEKESARNKPRRNTPLNEVIFGPIKFLSNEYIQRNAIGIYASEYMQLEENNTIVICINEENPVKARQQIKQNIKCMKRDAKYLAKLSRKFPPPLDGFKKTS